MKEPLDMRVVYLVMVLLASAIWGLLVRVTIDPTLEWERVVIAGFGGALIAHYAVKHSRQRESRQPAVI